MDLTNLTLVALVAYGTVAVIGFKWPNMDKQLKFGISFLVALAVTFIPANLAGELAQNIKLAFEAVLSVTAISKLADKAGGQ